jgi:hypothetical protein
MHCTAKTTLFPDLAESNDQTTSNNFELQKSLIL